MPAPSVADRHLLDAFIRRDETAIRADVPAGTFTDPAYVELTVGIARADYANV